MGIGFSRLSQSWLLQVTAEPVEPVYSRAGTADLVQPVWYSTAGLVQPVWYSTADMVQPVWYSRPGTAVLVQLVQQTWYSGTADLVQQPWYSLSGTVQPLSSVI